MCCTGVRCMLYARCALQVVEPGVRSMTHAPWFDMCAIVCQVCVCMRCTLHGAIPGVGLMAEQAGGSIALLYARTVRSSAPRSAARAAVLGAGRCVSRCARPPAALAPRRASGMCSAHSVSSLRYSTHPPVSRRRNPRVLAH